jgi:predicted Zn-dependent protease
MTRLRSLLLAAGTLLLAAGCGFDGDGPVVSESERRMGAEQHPLLLGEFGGSYDAAEAAYVARLGEKIAGEAGLEGQCTFTLVNSDVVNAFAVPGCYIYVTRGLMSIVNSEGELAAVLAHELGHIVGEHVERQQRRSFWRGLGVAAVEVITGSERLTRLAGAAAGFFTLRYSRKQEYEADDLGVAYLQQAGYDPYAAADMLDALGRHEAFLGRTRGRDEASSIPEWARTHPLTEGRVARARQGAAATGVQPDAMPENEAEYLREVDGLLYGDDPGQGFVVGRRFAHPRLRIGFEAPEGFSLTNSPQAILVEGPDGMRGEFGVGRMPAKGPEAYAEAVLGQMLRDAPLRAGDSQRLTVNGLPALFLSLSVETREGPVPIAMAVYQGPDRSAYHFIIVASPSSPPGPTLEALFRSFRLISAEEAASLRARRIEVATARPGDTARSLAARMASEHPLDHFLMLNARTADQPVRPGEMVKIVTWAAR